MEKIISKEQDNEDLDETVIPDPEMSSLEGKGLNLAPWGIPSPLKVKNLLESKILGKVAKIVIQDQMLHGLPIAMAQVKAGNNSATLANEVRQMLYSMYCDNLITKKVSKNLM